MVLAVRASASSSVSGGGNLSALFRTWAWAEASVNYTYDGYAAPRAFRPMGPEADVPEPGVHLLLLSGIAIMGWRRKRRSLRLCGTRRPQTASIGGVRHIQPRKLSWTRPSVLLTGCLARRDLSCQQRAGAAPARRSNTARRPVRSAIGRGAISPHG
jgi:hypothetical protein